MTHVKSGATGRRKKEPLERDSELLLIQELFHWLTPSRAQEWSFPVPKRPPKLSRIMLRESDPRYYQVPGMRAGLALGLQERGRLCRW